MIVFVLATEVKVGMVRVWDGKITAICTSPSGKTVYITDSRMGEESMAPSTRIAIKTEA